MGPSHRDAPGLPLGAPPFTESGLAFEGLFSSILQGLPVGALPCVTVATSGVSQYPRDPARRTTDVLCKMSEPAGVQLLNVFTSKGTVRSSEESTASQTPGRGTRLPDPQLHLFRGASFSHRTPGFLPKSSDFRLVPSWLGKYCHFFFKSHFHLFIFYLKGGKTDRETERAVLFIGSLPKRLQQPGLGQTRSSELSPGLPGCWQGRYYWSHTWPGPGKAQCCPRSRGSVSVAKQPP